MIETRRLASYDRTHNLVIYGGMSCPLARASNGCERNSQQDSWGLAVELDTPADERESIHADWRRRPGQFSGQHQTADQIGPLKNPRRDWTSACDRPELTCAPTDLSCHYFDPSSFRAVPGSEIRFGTTGRNIIRGPGYFDLDASIFRDIRITERVKFQFRMELFGVTNTPHFNNPGTDPTNSATFGVITSTLNLAGRGTGTGGERQIWFAGRVTF